MSAIACSVSLRQTEATSARFRLSFRSDGSGGFTALNITRATRSGVSSILGIGFGGLPSFRFGPGVSGIPSLPLSDAQTLPRSTQNVNLTFGDG